MATEEAEVAAATQESTKKANGLVKTIGLAFGVFVLVVAAQFVTSIVGCMVMPGLMPGCTAHVAEDEAAPKEKGAKKEKAAKKAEEPKAPPVYLAFDPPLVVSFQEQATMRFLQVTVEVMARDEDSINAVKLHMPIIRNNLLNALSGKSLTELTSREGKEALRVACLAEVQRILKANADTGKDAKKIHVEDLYFTSFVVQ
jgi:flagellar FliL protein